METTLEIAEISIHLSVPFSYAGTLAFHPFHIPSSKTDIEITIFFHPTKVPIVWEENISPGERYLPLKKDGKAYLGYHLYGKKCHAWMETDGIHVTCYYLEDSVKLFPTEREVFYVVCLEHLLNLHHGFILHSSFIRWKGNGILFTAPSGTGKSTQASMWEKYERADILNGDRSALRLVKGIWKAFGLPFAGSSDIYRNESCPVCAIVVLRQAKKNKLKRLSEGEAFRQLYRQLTVHPWDSEFVTRIMDDLESLIHHIPVYQLSCLPNQEAVELLKQEIEVSLNGK